MKFTCTFHHICNININFTCDQICIAETPSSCFFSLFYYLSIYLSVYYLSICLFVHLSLSLSVCLSGKCVFLFKLQAHLCTTNNTTAATTSVTMNHTDIHLIFFVYFILIFLFFYTVTQYQICGHKLLTQVIHLS